MKFELLPVLTASIAPSLIAQCSADDCLASSRYTELNRCVEIADGMVEEGNDWISYQCDGLTDHSVWLTYADSARSYIGFGERENLSGPFSIERDRSWRIEWRGIEQDGQFEPFAAVIRMLRPKVGAPTDGKGLLFVFRIREDGTSCMIASDLESNDRARELADASRGGYDCQFEPDLPDP